MTLLKWPAKNLAADPSASQLTQLLNSLSDVVMMLDEQHQIKMINQCWQDITGISIEQTQGRTFTDFLHPEDIASWTQLMQNLRPDSKEVIWFRLISASGELRWCEMRLQSMEKNKLYPLSATLCDITPQVRNEQVRHASYRSLQSLVDRLPAMLYRARNNISWSMEYVSEGCELITGYSAENMLNQPQVSLGAMIHGEDAGYVWEQVQIALENRTTFSIEYRLTQADGKEIVVQDKGRGLYSESGMVLGVEGIIFQTTI
ncbi:PAS domain-containing protein [Methylophaga muralis]|uniref:histidine kinase n=1 Tax=Methylophaga muralis TaxID=291169 RepID=A0A1E3GW84_9GAMM|nr:PAS domain-containing protein [Methylophaga muralis]ODN67816.1 PAS fold protein [Methylophaga muralis]